ncbi:MAG: RsmD family RNA methyltransferase, partial [Gammaproteobacteria bacterium]|nr:RsmD family RNA methyltransferase [Gammaproteobacteria bacterium]
RGAATRLGANCRVHVASAPQWVRRQREWDWDLVFVDPPFGTRLGAETLALLRGRDILVYFEEAEAGARDRDAETGNPPGWETLRESRAGACRFRLLRPAGGVGDWPRLRGAASIGPHRA